MANPAVGNYGNVAGSVGLEDRTQILPTPNIPSNTVGIFGPDFNFPDYLPQPGQVGIAPGNTVDSVKSAIGGAATYADIIGFGYSSTELSAPYAGYIRPLGVRTFLRTGMTCSNGAQMWSYVNGIPDGSYSAGLKGLGPGIVGDAKEALNPIPILTSVFGTGYPECKRQTMPVGDQDGSIVSKSGKPFVEDMDLVSGGSQTRWIKSRDLTATEYSQTPKLYCFDGYPVKNHPNQDCTQPRMNNSMDITSSFVDYKDPDDAIEMIKMIMLATGVLAAVCVAHRYLSR